MNRARPYLNRFVKLKEQEIEDSYHSINLKDMKPVTSKQMTHQDGVLINNRKRDMIKEVREIQIERENKVLLQKISSVMSKKGAYSVGKPKSIRTKVNKSLNQFYRKRQMQNIELQNKRFMQRLHDNKPTMNMQKLHRDWQDNKGVIKRMANCQFNLTSIRSNSRVRAITTDKFYKSKYDKIKLSKMKNIGGLKMFVRVEFTDEVLKITGDCQSSKDIKVIEIPKDQAIMFIEKDCHGKCQAIFQLLKYDHQSETMYLVSDFLEGEDMDQNDFNPQIDRIIAKKKEDLKLKMDSRKQAPIETEKKSSREVIKKAPQQKQVKKSQEPQKQSVKVEEEKKESNHKVSEKRIDPQQPLSKQSPVQEPIIVQETKPEPVASKQQHVVEKTEEVIAPQEEKYQEEKFEETANLSELKKQSEQKIEPESKEVEQVKEEVKPVEVKEQVKEEVKVQVQEVKAEKLQEKKEEIKKEVIVAPEEVEDYNEEFQANQVENKKQIPQQSK